MCTFRVDNPELIRTILISTHQVFLWQGFMIAFCGFNVIVHRYVICFIIISISEWLMRTDINWLKMNISHAYFCSAKVDILLQTLRDSRHWIKPYYNIFLASYIMKNMIDCYWLKIIGNIVTLLPMKLALLRLHFVVLNKIGVFVLL